MRGGRLDMGADDPLPYPVLECFDALRQVRRSCRASTRMSDGRLELSTLCRDTLQVFLDRLPCVSMGHWELRWLGHDGPSSNIRGLDLYRNRSSVPHPNRPCT
jgi:hypothetical protein